MRSIRHAVAIALVAVAALFAGTAPAQEPEHVPTRKDPIRFTAFAVNMQGGMAGVVTIAIERWTTDAERKGLIALVQTATDRPHGQDTLLKGLQDVKPRVGFIRTSNSIGWDLKYAYLTKLPDGGKQIVIATDKPVSFLAVRNQTRTLDYPFSLVAMRFAAGSDTGEGKLLAQTSISVKNGQLELEVYGQEPTRLTEIKQEKPKKTT